MIWFKRSMHAFELAKIMNRSGWPNEYHKMHYKNIVVKETQRISFKNVHRKMLPAKVPKSHKKRMTASVLREL